jgi:hypothetical protein
MFCVTFLRDAVYGHLQPHTVSVEWCDLSEMFSNRVRNVCSQSSFRLLSLPP